jgi:serine/threonine-protein phosphatase 2A regulatory subunit B
LLQKGKLQLPRSKVINESWEGRCKQYYKNAHEYHINSLCISPDGENFLSADDLRINLWHAENSSEVYNLLDMKPNKIDELDEVISHCEFHPAMPTVFLYTTTKGLLHICDFRESSTFQNYSSLKYECGLGTKKNAFSDMLNSLSYGKFLK